MDAFDVSLAVVIGINDYSHGIPPLSTAVNDVTRLAEVLKAEHGYKVILLTQDVTKDRLTTLFTQEMPSRLGEDARSI